MANTLFYRAADLKEACVLLSQYGKKAKILAGGTDLMVAINRKLLLPEILVYIGNCGLDYIRVEGDSLIIGAMTNHASIVRSTLVKEKAPLLLEATKYIGSPSIRNMGTIGGNLVNASPAADAGTALLALGAKLNLVSVSGVRQVKVEEFFTGPGKTVLKPSEILQEVLIPSQNENSKWAWYKLGKRKSDICSVISVAISIEIEGNLCRFARIALGAVAPVPLLAKRAGSLLERQNIDKTLITKAAKAASEETTPIDDVRATAWYRRKVSETLVKRLLSQILE
ncbi:MAG: xanthine dehydrogenase family protein subunit M [Dehalococcoidia bacterium]|nr:MAG: xanthine dehydrogenase family protein subunit M [Dehalococcoidia bacterium]